MLEEVLKHIRNWFVLPDGIHSGEYIVQNGSITLPFLQDGQYFRIVGSIFNDGVYQYPTVGLATERFTGAVWALAIPQGVLRLTKEIEEWQAKNKSTIESPYQSESFAGYTYSKKTESNGSPISWQSTFKTQLSIWRKI